MDKSCGAWFPEATTDLTTVTTAAQPGRWHSDFGWQPYSNPSRRSGPTGTLPAAPESVIVGHKYNCFQRGQRNKGGRDCDGQALYLAERVDAIVLKIVEEVFEQIRDTPYSQVAENRIRQESNLQKTKRAAAEKKIKAAQHALERFEGEILKCLDGTSNFTEDMIAKQIRRYQQELDDAKAKYAELQNARLNEAAEIRKLRTYYDDFKGWAEEFDTAPLEMKRMILSHLIDRVEVGRKYQVIVKFNMKYRQFLECTAETYNTEIGA